MAAMTILNDCNSESVRATVIIFMSSHRFWGSRITMGQLYKSLFTAERYEDRQREEKKTKVQELILTV